MLARSAITSNSAARNIIGFSHDDRESDIHCRPEVGHKPHTTVGDLASKVETDVHASPSTLTLRPRTCDPG
jgi:hypothetical protein